MIGRRTLLAGGSALLASPALAAEPARRDLVGHDLGGGYKLTVFLRPATGPQMSELRRITGLGHMVVNAVDRSLSPDSPYDTAVEMWFPVGQPPSLPSFGTGALALATREVEIRRAPPGVPPRAKRMGLVRRREGLTRSDFQETWRQDHALIADGAYRLRRYILNIVDGAEGPWDGYAEMWWDSFEDMAESARKIAAEPSREAVSPFGAVLMLRMVEER